MTKDVLIQYCDLKTEVKDLRDRIDKLERQIGKIEDDGLVSDSVRGGIGGIQHFKITGFPYPEYTRKKTAMYMYKAMLENAELELLETTNDVEEYIQTIRDSRIRKILRLRYIDNLTWDTVGYRLGGGNNADSARKAHDRFLEKN